MAANNICKLWLRTLCSAGGFLTGRGMSDSLGTGPGVEDLELGSLEMVFLALIGGGETGLVVDLMRILALGELMPFSRVSVCTAGSVGTFDFAFLIIDLRPSARGTRRVVCCGRVTIAGGVSSCGSIFRRLAGGGLRSGTTSKGS
jgi:hypothetical protein